MKTATARVCLATSVAVCVLCGGAASAITSNQPGYTQIVVANIPTGDGNNFGGVVVGPDTNIYVVGGWLKNAFRITPGGTATTLTLNAAGTPIGVGIVGTTLYVGQDSGRIDTFDISQPSPTATFLTTVPGTLNGNGNADFALAPSGFGAYGGQLIACNGGVYAVNPTTGAKTNIFVGSGDWHSSLDFGPNGTLYVTEYNSGNVLTVTAAGSTSVFANLPGANPDGLAVHPGTGNIYVADPSGGKIFMITPAGVVSTFATSVILDDGFYPTGMAFSRNGTVLYYLTNTSVFQLAAIQGFPPIESIPVLGTLGWLMLMVLIAIAGAVVIRRALP